MNFKAGMKVKPFKKTVGGRGLENSVVWKEAQKNGQDFLYITEVNEFEEKLTLSDEENTLGDYYHFSDVFIVNPCAEYEIETLNDELDEALQRALKLEREIESLLEQEKDVELTLPDGMKFKGTLSELKDFMEFAQGMTEKKTGTTVEEVIVNSMDADTVPVHFFGDTVGRTEVLGRHFNVQVFFKNGRTVSMEVYLPATETTPVREYVKNLFA